MKESMERWKAEREANADYIAQLKKNKEDRRKEIEAQEALLQQMRDEEEAEEAAALEEEKKLEGDGEVPAEAKKVDAVPADSGKQNFADQKKFKSKDEQEYQEALTALIKPFDVSKLSEDDLKKKISELLTLRFKVHLWGFESEKAIFLTQIWTEVRSTLFSSIE